MTTPRKLLNTEGTVLRAGKHVHDAHQIPKDGPNGPSYLDTPRTSETLNIQVSLFTSFFEPILQMTQTPFTYGTHVFRNPVPHAWL